MAGIFEAHHKVIRALMELTDHRLLSYDIACKVSVWEAIRFAVDGGEWGPNREFQIGSKLKELLVSNVMKDIKTPLSTTISREVPLTVQKSWMYHSTTFVGGVPAKFEWKNGRHKRFLMKAN